MTDERIKELGLSVATEWWKTGRELYHPDVKKPPPVPMDRLGGIAEATIRAAVDEATAELRAERDTFSKAYAHVDSVLNQVKQQRDGLQAANEELLKANHDWAEHALTLRCQKCKHPHGMIAKPKDIEKDYKQVWSCPCDCHVDVAALRAECDALRQQLDHAKLLLALEQAQWNRIAEDCKASGCQCGDEPYTDGEYCPICFALLKVEQLKGSDGQALIAEAAALAKHSWTQTEPAPLGEDAEGWGDAGHSGGPERGPNAPPGYGSQYTTLQPCPVCGSVEPCDHF